MSTFRDLALIALIMLTIAYSFAALMGLYG